jgi:hypothetical protein
MNPALHDSMTRSKMNILAWTASAFVSAVFVLFWDKNRAKRYCSKNVFLALDFPD